MDKQIMEGKNKGVQPKGGIGDSEFKKTIIEKAKNAERESKYIDFKAKFDENSNQDWCEIVKDIVAVANSGGGVLLIGVNDNGSPSGNDINPVLNLDQAKVTDKISKYTGEQFSDFEITEIKRNRTKVAAIIINPTPIPLIFINPGTYSTNDGKQKTAFGKGTVYFRHGAKSEPGNSNDLRYVIERELEKTRKRWLGNIRKVVKAPENHRVHILPNNVRVTTEPTATPVRIVDDKNAPPFRLVSPDDIYLYREKEVVQRINERLKGKWEINPYDVLCIRRVYQIDETKPKYFHRPKYSSPQYSEEFVNWVVDLFQKNNAFFDELRKTHYERFVRKKS